MAGHAILPKASSMKILHVLSQYPDSTGSGIYLQAILQQADMRRHHNSLIAGVNSDRHPDSERIDADPVSLVEFNTDQLPFALPGMSDVMPYRSSKFSELSNEQLQAYEQSFLRTVQHHIAAWEPDIIHSHHLWLLSSLLKENFPHIPQVTSCHGTDLRQYRLCAHLRNHVKQGCRNIEKILALTTPQQEEITNLYGIDKNRIMVVGAGYNDTVFSWSSKPEPSPVQISYCGKLSRAKGVPWLLKAMSKLDPNSAHLHLIGSGSGLEEKECLRLAQSVSGQVTIHGPMSQEQLAKQLGNSHIFILPSLYEGLPLTILEALACGCRVIATDIPGCRALAEEFDEALVSLIQIPRLQGVDTPLSEDEPNFIHEIAAALNKTVLLAKKQPFLPRNILERSIRDFTWGTVFGEIEKVYVDLLNSKK